MLAERLLNIREMELAKERQSSMPSHQFQFQVEEEARSRNDGGSHYPVWGSNLMGPEEPGLQSPQETVKQRWIDQGIWTGTLEVDAVAYSKVKAAWIRSGIWDQTWALLPGKSWKHERPLDDVLANDAAYVEACRLVDLSRKTQSVVPDMGQVRPSNKKLPERPANHDKALRVRGVPRHWEVSRLETFLKQHDADLKVKSLAQEIHGRSSTGTVSCRDGSDVASSIPLSQDSASGTRPQVLTLDADFTGMTTLYAPRDENHRLDVVAISGLGGHAFGSFKERGGSHMWLRDALPHDLKSESTDKKMARVMTYGYESAVEKSQSVDNLEDLATGLHSSLLTLASSAQMKPIIFIAHSLGGLIMLITLAKSKQEDDKRLVKAVYGIVFFGVPHDGMDISSLIPMVGDGPNRFLVESLNRINSQILSMQQRDFHKSLGSESEIVCFYETRQSPTASQDKRGKWTMSGPLAVLVTKSSATHCRPWEDGPEHMCAVGRSHSEMVKFKDQDAEYEKASSRLRGLARRAVMGRRQRQALDAKFIVPYNKNPDFVGRSNILDDVKKLMGFGQRPGAGEPRSRVALHGLGGVGCVDSILLEEQAVNMDRKTQIVLSYVYWLQEACPDVSVFWVHASSADRFRQSYACIAQDYKIPGHNDAKKDVLLLVKQWLENKAKGPWLMVVDNADDEPLFFGDAAADRPKSSGNDKIGQYIPESGRGRVLVTTRNKKVALRLTKSVAACNVKIPKMADKDANKLMQTMLPSNDKNRNKLSKLCSRLENLPLALTQAAAFIQTNSISIDDYLKLLGNNDQGVVDLLSQDFETTGRDSEALQAVAQTWMVSFRKIQKQDVLAGKLLSLMCLFDRQAIPIKFLSHYSEKKQNGGPKSPVELTKSAGLLKAFSLVSEEKSGSLDMHRLVQLVTRRWLTMDGKLSEFEQQALLTVSEEWPNEKFENRTKRTAYLPHAQAVLRFQGPDDGQRAKASLLHRVAHHLDTEGRWNEAERFSLDSVKIHKKVLGHEHPHTLATMGSLAMTYRNQGRWKEAEKLELQVLKIRKGALGDDPHLDMNNLALTYQDQGRWKEAEKLQIQVWEARKRVLGHEHPKTLTSMNNLAATYASQGLLEKAQELDIQVLEARKRILGHEHPETLASMNNLASSYAQQRRFKEAEALRIQVWEAQKRVLGPEHPHTLITKANLASTYYQQRRLKKAENLQMQVWEAQKRVLGHAHPDTLTIMDSLALIYAEQGRLKESEKLHKQAWEARKKVLGHEHPSTLRTKTNLASTYYNQGRFNEAEQLEAQALKTRKQLLGKEHPETLRTMHDLACTWYKMRRINEAKALMRDCILYKEKVLGRDHPDTQSSASILAGW
ncbi:hypothetical protein CDD80_2380 [Ophiocordyceps camponoti-rufipedis]|uniref:DUF7779 domain-containing protein n=1 Tax=Ophiocordyceps camponoti-rufipedis TaxID=2004952 RepID=A0A2C5Z323_9HYPO|nr:hypothetical protein CDD80_2380 [Ophiocordyceps camponoti-rufipedis]